MTLARRRIKDAAALKALAHPVRTALLDALASEGPRTATQLAGIVDSSPSNCSWHLRKLAEHGFVREVRGRAGRNRPWQAVSEALEWGTGFPDPGTLAAEALDDVLVEREVQRLRAARAAHDDEPADWREATGLLHAQLWLTAEEAQQVRDTLRGLLLASKDRSAAPDRRPSGARPVSVVGWLVPSGPYDAGKDPP